MKNSFGLEMEVAGGCDPQGLRRKHLENRDRLNPKCSLLRGSMVGKFKTH